MSTAAARQSALDAVLDARRATAELADDLFGLADALAEQSALRRALTDPGVPDDARAELVRSLFDSRTGADAVAVLAEAARLRWGDPTELTDALEHQAVRALLIDAQEAHRLDEVEDQLFKVERLVAANPDLQATLGDRRLALDARAGLLAGLLAGRVDDVTVRLARRAVGARRRTFALTVEHYLGIAAGLRARVVATVEVARPLTDDQLARLRAALSRQAGRDVKVRVVVDPAVLGGVRVTLGDEVIEGTVAARLNDARRRLA